MMCQGIQSHERSWHKGYIYQKFLKFNKKDWFAVQTPAISAQLG